MKRRIKKPEAPRVYFRADKAHIAKIIKVRRMLCIGEDVKQAKVSGQ